VSQPACLQKIWRFTLNKYIVSILALLLLLSITACSEDDNATTIQILGYSLDQFISVEDVRLITDASADETTDFRELYAVEIVATDGWSPRNSSNAGFDLTWNQFRAGYLVPDDGNRTWFSDPDLPGAFRVREAAQLRLYRQITIADTAGDIQHLELGTLPVYPITNWDNACEDAIKLSDLVVNFTDFESVTLTAVDGYSRDFTPAQIADGYYLLESEITTFPTFNDSMEGGQKRFKKLALITTTGATNSAPHQYGNSPVERADLVLAIPELFDSYTATILTDY
jgi:hypothetical protein